MRPPKRTPFLRLGTRGSTLARIQSQWVADKIELYHPGQKVELVIVKTTGDQVQDRPLHDMGGKGLFTKELEEALLDGRVDLVVHSLKDVPVTMPLVDQAGLAIGCIPRRADPRDVFVSRDGVPFKKLKRGARIGTGSLRRRAQLLAYRPDLIVEPIRGNIDTRLAKCKRGEFDAVVLAMAGLHRAGLFRADDMEPIDVDTMLPAAAQGALAVQIRANDLHARRLLSVIDCSQTRTRVDLERAVILELNGDCSSPIGALATIEGDEIRLRACVGARNGEPPVIHAEAHAPLAESQNALHDVITSLNAQGARELLGDDRPTYPGSLRHA